MKKMRFIVEGVEIPWINIEAIGVEPDYAQAEPRIQIKGYKNREKIGLVETSKIEIRLSGLPEELQDLWEDFKVRVEDWVKKQENKD